MKRSVVTLLAFLASNPALARDMYDFRGLRLGATLSEVRMLAYPDAAKWPDAKLICTGDKERTPASSGWFAPNENLLKIGVVVCSYYRPGRTSFSHWGLDFIGVTRMQALLFFTPASFPEEQRLRLYMIALEAGSEHFDAISAALKRTYGEPNASRPKTLSSEGKLFDNILLGWQASGGILVTERYFQDPKTMYVSYLHERLSDAVDHAEQKASSR